LHLTFYKSTDNTKQFQKRTYTNDKCANKKVLIFC